ncbi:MAG: flotillin-like FloA family protein, partial [Anaerolineae bacterium]|nr:flotillin-like FloA family protein [Phycisphaerae bacterium]
MPAFLAQPDSTWSTGWVILLVIVLLFFLIIFGIMFQFVGLYVRALVSGARVSFADLIGMRLRKFNTTMIVNSRIQAVGAGLSIPLV